MKHNVDVHVGKRIRHRRWMIGMTQQQLAEKVGIKFQQIQKYETGMNRVSASRLWDIAQAVDVPVSFFFEGLEDGHVHNAVEGDILADKEALQLVRAYYAMPEAQRRQIFELARVLSDAA
ncbi:MULTISPECIES: helix-turn-helix domain-containing protein [Paracoccus]|uniref:Transcriptional regulator, XRE family n=1 Tax=Paracoccus denitrificans (strain Pd 1222) TaxID=318586 RepID=A1B1U5_PARDP|nr:MULTISPECIES: helix-turn-helix transcriptional regulator [Paracoccus]ABL69489.1 transcriptional regulator, XRE family [Paracoccus denitrificans PD1222]KRW94553.1 Cro/Cl family transcriptional regulator [Paracoccus sp. MKU1]MCU7427779.1 helix-turn-helix domain-containing protein [Paracoccus denitrificans]QAR25036.1 XRE family transcriptional regulator [Paracoccus denitrificans]UFS64843.1 helix-turn-helix domain-containing protein [Paracoccus denitrificans]